MRMNGRISFLLSLVLSWVVVGFLGIGSSLYLLEYRTKFVLKDEEVIFPHSISRIHLLPDGRRLGFSSYPKWKKLTKKSFPTLLLDFSLPASTQISRNLW
jgi:hypothetical protein